MGPDHTDEPSTEELRTAAAGRESEERDLLDKSATKDEAHQHRRRADKQAYLKEKLAEREASEREAAEAEAKREPEGDGAD